MHLSGILLRRVYDILFKLSNQIRFVWKFNFGQATFNGTICDAD